MQKIYDWWFGHGKDSRGVMKLTAILFLIAAVILSILVVHPKWFLLLILWSFGGIVFLLVTVLVGAGCHELAEPIYNWYKKKYK